MVTQQCDEATDGDLTAWQCQLQTQVCHEEPRVYPHGTPAPSNRGKPSPSRVASGLRSGA